MVHIGKIEAVRHDAGDVVKFRRALRDHGVDEAHHEKVLAAARSSNILNDTPDDTSYIAAAASAVKLNDKPLAERIEAAAANPKKKESVRFALNLLKRLQIPVEACADRASLAAALKTKSLDERFQVKSALSFAGILD
jgi:hypothetical protein